MSLTLMLVDDHRMLRQGLRRALEDEGFEVVGEAADGYDAVLRAPELKPDVILMDVSMPNVGGVEATRRIVQNEPERRVLMLTMHADKDLIETSIKAGAVGYLTKDCSIEEVVAAVRMAASGDTALSSTLAHSMLDEVTKIESTNRDGERMITAREEEVLQLVADGCSTSEVADKLFISQKTVKNHLASIYEKLNARDRTQAVLIGVKMGIIRLA
jgi:two-component system, NarL family, response regulator DegU